MTTKLTGVGMQKPAGSVLNNGRPRRENVLLDASISFEPKDLVRLMRLYANRLQTDFEQGKQRSFEFACATFADLGDDPEIFAGKQLERTNEGMPAAITGRTSEALELCK